MIGIVSIGDVLKWFFRRAAIDNPERYVTRDYPPDLFPLRRLRADGATRVMPF
jgi:hypothetical protein